MDFSSQPAELHVKSPVISLDKSCHLTSHVTFLSHSSSHFSLPMTFQVNVPVHLSLRLKSQVIFPYYLLQLLASHLLLIALLDKAN